MIKIVGVSGSLSNPSRTKSLVQQVLNRIAHRTASRVEFVDVAEIALNLGSSIAYDRVDPAVTHAHRQLAEADIIVIGSPVYKASYTGLMKHFFDLIDPKLLAGKVAILVATGGSDQHASVLEYHLRPLASFLGMVTTPTAIFARDTEFLDYQLNSEAIAGRIEQVADQSLDLLGRSSGIALAA